MDATGKSQETPSAPDAETVEAAALTGAGGTTPPPPPKQDRYLGRTIDGRYAIEALLGEGGMGYVYRGRHKVIDKRVAIKILKTDHITRDREARAKELTERFLVEAKSASAIGNPHIVDISDFGTLPDGATYFVMELLDGPGLGVLLNEHKGRGMPVPRILHIGKQIAAGLGAAHEAGIIHRDLKPDNVILITRGKDKDFVKVLDFGIAKVLGGESQKITRAGSVFGTPHYMSPEQAAGTPVDQRTDIYALGVILYEMASGRVPFDADNFMGILTQHMYRAPVPMLALVPPPGDVPVGLDAVVLKCLSKKPEQRYASMGEVVEDLQRLEQGVPPQAVNDMMSRSGGFNVPQDYFRRPGGMPEAVPATPTDVPGRSRWPLFAVVGALVGLGAFALTIALVTSKPSGAKGRDPTVGVPSASVSATIASVASSAPAAPVARVEPAARQLLLTVSPLEAKLLRNGEPLEGPPFAVSLKPGERAELLAKCAGYTDKTVILDDHSEARQLVTMQRPPQVAGPVKPVAPPPSAKPVEVPPIKPAVKKPCDITDKNCDPWK